MNFDDAALSYDESAFAQKQCAEELVKMLPNENIASFIDIGAGTGFASVAVLKKFPNARAVLLDKSAKMLEIAKTKIPCATTIIADAEVFEFSTYNFDLAIANLSLQWFKDLGTFMTKVSSHAKYFAFSIPLKGSFKEYFDVFRNVKYPDIKLYTESAILDIIQQNAKVVSAKRCIINETYPNAIEAARHFRNIGAITTVNQQIQSKIAARLKAHQTPVTISYDMFLCLLKSPLTIQH